MRTRAFILLGLLGLASSASAEPRFHRLTPRLAKRLGARAQRTTGAIAELRRATAFVVAHDPQPTARALVLTNHHVAGQGVAPGEPLRFLDGTVGHTVGVVASNPALDYALVEVSLPWGSRAHALPLHADAVAPNRRVYSASAYANLRSFPDMPRAVGGGTPAHAAIALGPGNEFAISVARAHATDTAPTTIQLASGPVTVARSGLPNASGMSGAPVLAHDTHGVIGLHTSGTGKPGPWEESSVPASLILQDLRAKRAAGGMSPDTARLVDQIFLGAR